MFEAALQSTPERLQQTNVITRFLQSPQPLMLIVGEKDSGKTSLLSDIILQMRASRLTIRLQGTPNLHPSQLVHVLSKQWHIPHVSKHQRIENQLDEVLIRLAEKTQACILIIDDAHLLSLSVLAAISHLVTQQDGKPVYLHILLTGRPVLAEKINSLQTKEIPRLTVGALSREEAFRKIKHLIDSAGLHLPHAAANAIFNKLYRRSEGMPQTLESMVKKLIAQRSIIDQPHIVKPEKITKSPSFWKAHRIKTFSLTSLFVLGYFFWLWQHHQLERNISSPKPIIQTQQTARIRLPRPRTTVTPKLATTPVVPGLPKYTLQLMSGMNTKAMTNFIQQHHLASNAQIMKTQYKGHDWYVLTYGQYKKPSQAKINLSALPTDIKSLHPWVRSIKHLLSVDLKHSDR